MSSNFRNEMSMFQDVLDGKTIGNPTKIEEASDTSYAEPIEEHVEISKEMYIQMIGTAPDGARTQEEINESKILLEESLKEEALESDPQTSVLLTEDTGQELISLLTEVKGLLSEMCSFAGGMGVSMAGPGPEDEGPPLKKKKKRKKLVR
jgi:hypothetical protein